MPIFRLSPVSSRSSHPLWQFSQAPHEECYVAADTEQTARAAAARHFRMGSAMMLNSEVVKSPWLARELTTCAEVSEAMGNMPVGLVYRASSFPHAHQIQRK
jgi:hypothetical protein